MRSIGPLALTQGGQASQHKGGHLGGREVRVRVVGGIETLTILNNILRQREMTELPSQQQQYL